MESQELEDRVILLATNLRKWGKKDTGIIWHVMTEKISFQSVLRETVITKRKCLEKERDSERMSSAEEEDLRGRLDEGFFTVLIL